jgi:basic membrane protein A
VVALGYGIARDVDASARRFAKTHFALIDGVVEQPNVESVTFAVEQSGYLAGALAALVSRTGTVAFLGGADVTEIRPAEVGFLAGARAVRPGVTTVVRYVGSFDDRAGGARLAARLYGERADVVYAAAGRSGLGAIDAAKARRAAYVIGSDADQDALAPGIVLASALKHVDVAVLRVCQETASHKPISGRLVLGLADGAVGLSGFRYTKAVVGAARIARLERLRAAIAAGRVVPPATRAALAGFRAAALP